MFSANTSQVSDDKLYVEDVFSTTLYAGTGSFRGINVGIDKFAVNGGMIWMKSRDSGSFGAEIHRVYDTVRAGGGGGGTLICSPSLQTNSPDLDYSGNSITFYPTGQTITVGGSGNPNSSGYTYAAWSFRKAPKFFDLLTYSGNGSSSRTISHSLGVRPGMVIIKSTSGSGNWYVYVQDQNDFGFRGMELNNTGGVVISPAPAGSSYVTPTEINLTNNWSSIAVNASGTNYIMYLFAHDTGSDSFIKCGSYTGNGSTDGPIVTLGWEPQWILIKRSSGVGAWQIYDNMRGIGTGGTSSSGNDRSIYANQAATENYSYDLVDLLPTGFRAKSSYTDTNGNGEQYVYVAIRRGPMKAPTNAANVFIPIINSGPTGTEITTNFPVDFSLQYYRPGALSWMAWTKLTGGINSGANGSVNSTNIRTNNTDAESGLASGDYYYDNVSFKRGGYIASSSLVYYNFRRAPSFFDTVCYTGTGTNNAINHNLGVQPELIIIKRRDTTSGWPVWSKNASSGNLSNGKAYLNGIDEYYAGDTIWSSPPTATQLSISTSLDELNASGGRYIAYLFASCPGVSKIGSYSGNGGSQTINCGFAAGARFVMIKRTNATGSWYIWDTARGISDGNDPHISPNNTSGEVTSNDTIDTDNSGFVVNQNSGTNVNLSGATYIYLAIA